jgi:hypothetical protein
MVGFGRDHSGDAAGAGGCGPVSVRGRGWDELGEQRADPSVDLVSDGADLFQDLAGRVGEIPVEVALAGEDGAGVAAAH